MSNWFDQYKTGLKRIDAASFYLDNLSEILYQAGDEKLSKRMRRLHLDLEMGIKEIDDAVAHNMNEQYKQSLESSANILKAALAGGELAKREENSSD